MTLCNLLMTLLSERVNWGLDSKEDFFNFNAYICLFKNVLLNLFI